MQLTNSWLILVDDYIPFMQFIIPKHVQTNFGEYSMQYFLNYRSIIN